MTRYRRLFSRGDYHWPSGIDRAIATFSVRPEDFTARTGVALLPGLDGLDYFRAIGIELSSGQHVVLLWYERAPTPGLDLLADALEDPATIMTEVMHAFDLVDAEVLWCLESGPPAR